MTGGVLAIIGSTRSCIYRCPAGVRGRLSAGLRPQMCLYRPGVLMTNPSPTYTGWYSSALVSPDSPSQVASKCLYYEWPAPNGIPGGPLLVSGRLDPSLLPESSFAGVHGRWPNGSPTLRLASTVGKTSVRLSSWLPYWVVCFLITRGQCYP